jgi:TRAP-type C4-dicarboxylate transport system permease small subunit
MDNIINDSGNDTKNGMLKYFFDHFEEIVAGVMLFVILALVCVEILSRGVMNRSIVWIEEITRVIFIWAIFIGAAAGIKTNQLVSIDMLYNYLAPGKFKPVLEAVIFIVVFCSISILGYTGYNLMVLYMSDILPMSSIPKGWLYASVPVGTVIMMFRLIDRFIKDVILKKKLVTS